MSAKLCHSNPASEAANHMDSVPISSMSATKSFESSPPTPCSDQIANLERRIAELEQVKAHLTKAVSESNQRVAEAEKSTAAAQAETTAAKQRAQTRYTEKLHANNETRKLQEAMKEQAFQHHDSSIKADRLASGLKARIVHLETEISTKEAKIQELEEKLHEIHTGFLSNQRKEVNIETQPDKIVYDLKNKIIRLELYLAKAEQEKEQAVKDKDAIAKSRAKIEKDQAYFKNREMEPMQTHQIILQDAYLHWHSKLESMKKQEIQMAKELKEAKREAEVAMQKSQMANRTMQNTPQEPGVQQQQQQQQQQHQTSNSDKKRRFSTNGNTENITPAFQRARKQSLILNSISISPNQLTGSSRGVPNTEAQPITRQPMSMAQNIGYRQYPSVSFDSLAGPRTPIPTAQQHFPGYGPSPVQQHGISTQPRRLIGQQQSIGSLSPQQQPGLVQNARLNNMGSQAQTHSNHRINVPLAINTGAIQQSYHSMIHQPPPSFMPSRTHQSNSMNASFSLNTQGNASSSAFGNDVFATESSNITPGNINFLIHNDLGFANYPTGETFQEPLYSDNLTKSMNDNAQSQNDANATPVNTNITWSGGQRPAPHEAFAPR